MKIDIVEARIAYFQSRFRIADENARVTTRLLELLKAHPIGGRQVHDANIVATMLVYGITQLLTHNVVDFHRFSSRITLLPLIP